MRFLSQGVEFSGDLINRRNLLKEKIMLAFGYEICGQGYMIESYSECDLDLFCASLECDVATVKKLRNKDRLTIIDAGANLGFNSLGYSRLQGVRVVTFEPSPETYSYLQTNEKRNRIENVEAWSVGLFSETTTHRIGAPDWLNSAPLLTRVLKFSDKYRAGSASIYTDDLTAPVAFFEKGYSCEVITNLESIDLIKIDAEGSEVEVLRGLQETILRHRPVLIVEVSSHSLESADTSVFEVFELLKTLGYERCRICGADHHNDDWQEFPDPDIIKSSRDYMFV